MDQIPCLNYLLKLLSPESNFQNSQQYENLRKFHRYYARNTYRCNGGPWVNSAIENRDELERIINKFIIRCRQENQLFDENLFRHQLMLN